LAVSYFADRHSTLELWDMKENLKTGDGVPYITLAVESENPGELPFAFRTDSKRLALISYDTITLWNLDTQTQQAVIQGVRQVQGLAFNADGSLLAATIDVEARPGIGLWDTETGVQLFALKGHKSRITALAFNRDGTLLASASLDGTVRLWGIPTTH
jgi:WD40 repeat protein